MVSQFVPSKHLVWLWRLIHLVMDYLVELASGMVELEVAGGMVEWEVVGGMIDLEVVGGMVEWRWLLRWLSWK